MAPITPIPDLLDAQPGEGKHFLIAASTALRGPGRHLEKLLHHPTVPALRLSDLPELAKLDDVSENPVVDLRLDEAGLATELPRPNHPQDQIHDVPFRPVQFRDDDLPNALERSADWLRRAEAWLGEPVDVIAIHLDYDDDADSPYYEVKLLCNDEDLAGAPVAIRAAKEATEHPPTG